MISPIVRELSSWAAPKSSSHDTHQQEATRKRLPLVLSTREDVGTGIGIGICMGSGTVMGMGRAVEMGGRDLEAVTQSRLSAVSFDWPRLPAVFLGWPRRSAIFRGWLRLHPRRAPRQARQGRALPVGGGQVQAHGLLAGPLDGRGLSGAPPEMLGFGTAVGVTRQG